MKLIVVIFIVVIFLFLALSIFMPKAANNDSLTVAIESESDREEVAQGNDDNREYVESEVLVKFKKVLSEDELKDFIEDYSLEVLDIITAISVYQFKILSELSVEEIVSKLSKNSLIEYAEPNYVVEFQL